MNIIPSRVFRNMKVLKTTLHKVFPLAMLFVLSLCSEPETPRPEITTIDPKEGSVGTIINIIGKNLGGATSILFGTTSTYPASQGDSQITTVVPPGITPGPIAVTIKSDGGISNAFQFTVLPNEPEITSIEPDRASIGSVISIHGKYLVTATTVTFKDQAVTTFESKADDLIKIKVPEGLSLGALDVFVTAQGGVSPVQTFTVVGKPVINSFTPTLSSAGKVVTISGLYFEDASKVYFDTAKAIFSIQSAAVISATVPVNARTGKLKVITPGGTATSALDFTIKGAPVITSFTPISGIAGTTVTINGQNFDAGTVVVKFGTGLATDITVVSATQLTAKVPANGTTGKITVETTSGTVLSTNDFTVIGAPTISSFTPTSGSVNLEVTISGTNFINVNSVKFNGTNVAAGNYTVVSTTEVKAKVPTGANAGKVSIITPTGTATSSSDFNVLQAPVVSAFNPANGTPGNNVVITGTGFTGTTHITFNGVEVGGGNFTVNSATQITAKVPGGATSGKITVTNPQGSSTSANNFYVTPFISNINPTSGNVGSVVTITGTNLESAVVKFNSVSATPTNNTGTSITVTVPAGVSGGVNVTVVNSGGTSNSKTFTVASIVVIDEVVATANITDQLLLLKGSNLQNASKVMFGGTQASIFTNTSKVVTTKIPTSLTPGNYAVTLITSNGTSNAKDFEVLNTQNSNSGDVNMVNGANVSNLPPGYVPPVSNQWSNDDDPLQRFLISESDNSVVFSNNFIDQATGTIKFDKPNNYFEMELANIRYVGVWTPRTTAPDGFGGTRCYAHMILISAESGKQLRLTVEYFDGCP